MTERTGSTHRSLPWLRLFVEAVLIVGSILLALALDAWWDRVQEDRRRAELVEQLRQDFETTRARLAESIALADTVIAQLQGFLAAAHAPQPIPMDSLRFLASGVGRGIGFEPALSAYRSAVATGELRLIQGAQLIEAFVEFDEAMNGFDLHRRITADLFYLGATFELRKRLGMHAVLTRPPEELPAAFRLSETGYRALIREPDVFATMATVLTANRNIRDELGAADAAAQRILDGLRDHASRRDRSRP